MSTTVKYGGSNIASFNNTIKTLRTGGTWVEEDIEITDSSIPGCDAGHIYQDESGYIVIDEDVSSELNLKTVTFDVNGEYPSVSGTAYSSVTAAIPQRDDEIIERTILKITKSDLNGITIIGTKAFKNCLNLYSVEFPPSVTTIGEEAFYHCASLDNVTIPPTITHIQTYAFFNTGLTSIIIPKTVTNMGSHVCDACASLVSAEIYGAKTWDTNAGSISTFINCTKLESVKIVGLNFSGNGNEFNGCTSLTDVYCPKSHILQGSTFKGCTSLKKIALPNDGSCLATAFENAGIEEVDFGVRTQFYKSGIFKNCASLGVIVLRGTTLTSLTYTDVFTGTPFAENGSGGVIYIPKALYDELGTGSSLDYKAATNWSTFDGYGTITWAKIEGSKYEHYYVDGRGVLQTVTPTLINCTLSNDIAHYHTEFVAEIIPDDGYSVNSVTVTMASSNITSTAYDSETKTITIPSPDGEIVITASAI